MAIIYGKELIEIAADEAEGKNRRGLQGELRVLERLDEIMPADCIIIAKPNIGQYEPDLLLIQPNGQFVLAEVKNTALDSMRAIHPNGLLECQSYQMNPLEQVKLHRDQLHHFVHAVSKQDIYRNIGHCTIFPSISIEDFKKKFKRDLNLWKNSDTNNFLKHHLFLEDLRDTAKWQGCFKFKTEAVPLSQGELYSLVNKMKPRRQASFCLNIQHAEEIRTLAPLQATFKEMENSDADETRWIRQTFQTLVQHAVVTAENASSQVEAILALKNLRMELAQELHPYLNKANELTLMENKLITKGNLITEAFKEKVETELKEFFDAHVELMKIQIQRTTKWHSTLLDSSKKASGLVLGGTRKLLELNEKTKTAAEKLSDVDSRTGIEQMLASHLSPARIQETTEMIVKKASAEFETNWKQIIDEYSYYVTRFSNTHQATGISQTNLSAKHTVGVSEQVLGLTLGSAVIGTVGLAAGWHTLTYAALNVFPPIAFFAAIATVTTGILTKNQVIEARKAEVQSAADSMYTHIMNELNPPRTKVRTGTLFAQVDTASEIYVKEALKKGTEQLLGGLSVDHYQALIHAFHELDLLLLDSLEKLEEQVQ